MLDKLEDMTRKIEEADMILVGIGEAFQYDWHDLAQDLRFRRIEDEVGNDENKTWIVPFLQKMILEKVEDERLRVAYSGLEKLLENKNYFIVSLCDDDYIYRYGFEEERIVTPCGGFRNMQCDFNCCGEVQSIPLGTFENVKEYYNGKVNIEDLQEPICEKCGNKLRFNQLGVTKYAQEGYLDNWNQYTKWLQGTVNKKLCVLELGVGLVYPSIIRFPFEKVVMYNQKAFFYRVHKSLYQIGGEIAERGCGIQADPLEFITMRL